MSETWEYGEEREIVTRAGFPWPPPEDGPMLAALGATWKGATFDPGRFFADSPRDRGTGAALVYYLALGILVAGATLFWDSMALARPAAEGSLMTERGIRALSPVTRFLLAPALLLAGLYISAGVVHVLLLIFDGASHGFGTTVRVFCYSYSPAVFGIVPYIGPLVGGIWSVVVVIIGLREAHQAAAWKPVVAVLAPFLAMVLFVVLATVLLLMAGGIVP